MKLAVLAGLFPILVGANWKWEQGDSLTLKTGAIVTQGNASLKVTIFPVIGFAGISRQTQEGCPDSVSLDVYSTLVNGEIYLEINTTEDTVITPPVLILGGAWNTNIKFATATTGSLKKFHLIFQGYPTTDLDSIIFYVDRILFFKNNQWELWEGFEEGPVRVEEEISQENQKMCIFPNPFNSTTTIKYSTDKMSWVTLKVYDITGNLIKTLIDEKKSPGFYSITWDGKNNQGDKLTGIYFCKLQIDNQISWKKLILLPH